MKFLIFFVLTLGELYAACDIKPLQKKIIREYKSSLPVTNEKGEIGHAKAKNFAVADYLMRIKNENLLIANFDLDIKWLSGKKQTVRTLVVATVNPKSCQIESYRNDQKVSSHFGQSE